MSATASAVRQSLITCTLHEAHDLSKVGNKAHNLSQMLNLGLNVPAGFVVMNSAFRLFLEANRIDLAGDPGPI
jgi:phosphoenolpyruvate synthase/pyruvate phosphate dikinase